MWTAAAHLTELVARYRGRCAKAADRANRVLSDAHFMFRGAVKPRKSGRRPVPEEELDRLAVVTEADKAAARAVPTGTLSPIRRH